jgi:transketolase
MRNYFFDLLLKRMKRNKKIVVITADVGYSILEKIQNIVPEQYFNVGTREQAMIGMAIGMSYEGFIPFCYSITPFLLFRPYELIRNYLIHEQANVKLVGCGRDADYFDAGFTHYCGDDHIDIQTYKPEGFSEVKKSLQYMLLSKRPQYINLTKKVSEFIKF